MIVEPRIQTGWHTLGSTFVIVGALISVAGLPFLAVKPGPNPILDARALTALGFVWGATFWIPGVAFLTVPSAVVSTRNVAVHVTPFGVSGTF